MVNPNHDWEFHTVDFNACLLTLDNLDEGDGLLILSHDSGGCYLGFVHLLKLGFNGLCIAASIFVPQHLAVDGNTIQHLIDEVREQMRGNMLNTAALDRLFATEYPEKDYVPDFQPQHGKSIACRVEEWTDESLNHLLDSRCLFQPAYAPHRATLLINSLNDITCNGIDITSVPVVVPEPAPEPVVVEEPEPEEPEESEPEVTVLEDEPLEDVMEQEEVGVDNNDGVEVLVVSPAFVEQENGREASVVSYSRELTDVNDSAPSDEGTEVVESIEPIEIDDGNDDVTTVDDGGAELHADSASADDGVEVLGVYPIPPNAAVPPMPPVPPAPPEIEVVDANTPRYGMAEFPTSGGEYDSVAETKVPQDSNGDNSSTRKLVIFLLLLLVGILLVFIVSVGINSDSSDSTTDYVAEDSTVVAPIYDTEQVSVEAEEDDLSQRIYEAYVAKLESKAAAVGDFEYASCWYFLYDITGDGVPELWVKCGTCEADYMLYVYRYDVNELSLMHSTGAGHSSFYCGDSYVIQMMAHMGEAIWFRLTLDGSGIDEEKVYEETDEEGGYTYPDEPEADLYDYDETWPIAAALGV